MFELLPQQMSWSKTEYMDLCQHANKYKQVGLLRVSKYSDIRGSEYKIEYEYSSLPKSLDRDLFFFTFFFN